MRFFRGNSGLIGACLILVLLVMTVMTSYYFPKTYGDIVSFEEIYPGKKPFTFEVNLGLDENWRVKSWTDKEGTNFTVTLTGHPIADEVIFANNHLKYTWMLNSLSSGAGSTYEFVFKVPQSSHGNKWVFNISVNGYGSIYLTIRKFDRYYFHMFFIPDVIGMMFVFAIIILVIRYNTKSRIDTYQF